MIRVPTTQTGHQRITSEWIQVIARVFLRKKLGVHYNHGFDTNCNTPLKRNIRDAQISTNAHSTSSNTTININKEQRYDSYYRTWDDTQNSQ